MRQDFGGWGVCRVRISFKLTSKSVIYLIYNSSYIQTSKQYVSVTHIQDGIISKDLDGCSISENYNYNYLSQASNIADHWEKIQLMEVILQ